MTKTYEAQDLFGNIYTMTVNFDKRTVRVVNQHGDRESLSNFSTKGNGYVESSRILREAALDFLCDLNGVSNLIWRPIND